MYRDRKQIITDKVHNFVMNNAALGDMITSLPAVVHAMQFYESAMDLRVWVPTWQKELVAHLLAPYGKIEIRDFLELPTSHKEREAAGLGPFSYNGCVPFDLYTRCRVHIVDYAFNFLLNARPESMLERSYPTAAPLGPRSISFPYVVFPVGATSDNKLFRASVMAPIMEWCLENGYRPVVVGTKMSHTATKVDGVLKPVVLREQTDLLPPAVWLEVLDLREKTTLLELRDVLGHASAVVGVDGGTLHLAGTTDTNIIFSSGTTLPKHRYIARHGKPDFNIRYVGPRDLECTGCQSNWKMNYWHFTQCAYQDNLCMSLLNPEDFVNGLKEMGL